MPATGARLNEEDEEKSGVASVGEVREVDEHSPPARKQRGRAGWWSRLALWKKLLVVVLPTLAILALALGLGLGLGLAHKQSVPAGPAPKTTWDLPLAGDFTLNATYDPFPKDESTFLSVDLFNTAAAGIKRLTDDGHVVACYFSAGSLESWRPDAAQFPDDAVGSDMVGWQNEKWVNVRDSKIRDVMSSRISMAQSKGCSGVDADNINGYENDTGFNLTQADAVDFVRFLAQEAHGKGLLFGLKNGGEIVQQVLDVSDWVINEQCVKTGECDKYAPFIQNNKAVFHVEYTDDDNATSVDATLQSQLCGAGGQQGFSTIIKHMQLDAWVIHCD